MHVNAALTNRQVLYLSVVVQRSGSQGVQMSKMVLAADMRLVYKPT